MPTHATPPRDPRTIVTPDAFEVSKQLLGLPLASPGKRLAAILIDLAVIGVVTAMTKSFALVLGVVAAVLFIREGFKRTPVRGSVFGRAMRLSVGCLGLWIGIITVVVWGAVGIGGGLGRLQDESPRVSSGADGETTLEGLGGIMELVQGLGDVQRLTEAGTAEDAQAAANDLARRGREVGLDPEQIRDVLLGAAPDDAAWSDRTDEIVERAVAAALGDTVLTREMAEAAAREGADTANAVLADPVVADTLRTLERRITALSQTAEARREAMDDLETQLREEREGGSLFSWLRNFVDELGFGFGWASLYLTVMLSWWKGQTVGKRVMKIRVLRLDGEPITWWTAFERAGGYAAGFATGLLGFAQVFWDSNRQAIHDRIVGTVVVVDGAEPVLGWEHTL